MQYRELTQEDLGEVSRLLMRAYKDYCLFKEPLGKLFKEEETYEALLYHMFYMATKANLRKYVVLGGIMDGKIVTTLTLQPPNGEEIGMIDYLKNGVIKLLRWVSPLTIFKFSHLNEDTATVCKRLKPNAWFAESFVVDPDYQGQGLGSKMIHECVVPYVKAQRSEEISLSTCTEANCRFYQRNGFIQIDAGVIQYEEIYIKNWSYYYKI